MSFGFTGPKVVEILEWAFLEFVPAQESPTNTVLISGLQMYWCFLIFCFCLYAKLS